VYKRRQEALLSPVPLVVFVCVRACIRVSKCTCARARACVCERNEVYKLTKWTNKDFTVNNNTILNVWPCGMVRNLRENFYLVHVTEGQMGDLCVDRRLLLKHTVRNYRIRVGGKVNWLCIVLALDTLINFPVTPNGRSNFTT